MSYEQKSSRRDHLTSTSSKYGWPRNNWAASAAALSIWSGVPSAPSNGPVA